MQTQTPAPTRRRGLRQARSVLLLRPHATIWMISLRGGMQRSLVCSHARTRVELFAVWTGPKFTAFIRHNSPGPLTRTEAAAGYDIARTRTMHWRQHSLLRRRPTLVVGPQPRSMPPRLHVSSVVNASHSVPTSLGAATTITIHTITLTRSILTRISRKSSS